MKKLLTGIFAFLITLSVLAVVPGQNITLDFGALVQCNNGTIERNWTSCPTGWSAGGLIVDPGDTLKAFPSAYGFGAVSVGGRGGAVIKVTNLNESGAGSLAAALSTTGPRIVVFEVSGIINLTSELMVTEPYVTIAGQTSPGGILITGHTFTLNTHDVIVRHVRFRTGSHETTANGGLADPSTLDSVKILGDTIPGGSNDGYNVIFDHVSVGWGIDENLSVTYRAHDITIQNSIVSQGLTAAGHEEGNHSKGLLISGKFPSGGLVATDVSLYRNYFVHNQDRNPRAGGPFSNFTDIRNNVSYNYQRAGGIVIGDEATANIVHNYLKRGPYTNPASQAMYDINYADGPSVQTNHIYLEGNISESRPLQTDPEWSISSWTTAGTILTTAYQKLTPYVVATIPTEIASLSMANGILTGVGATVPIRDSIDTQDVADFAAGTSGIRTDVTYPDDYPTFSTPAPPADTDNDGMADSWETANGLNVGTNDSTGTALSALLYTNIECYLNELAGDSPCQ